MDDDGLPGEGGSGTRWWCHLTVSPPCRRGGTCPDLSRAATRQARAAPPGTRWKGGRGRVIRILGTLEPGGAQLSALRLSVALRRHGVATTLLAGDATPAGLELAARYGLAADPGRGSHVLPPDTLQWTPPSGFARWLHARTPRARLGHAHMMGAWWA